MGETLDVSLIICTLYVILWAVKVLYIIWWTPKKLERALRKQGIEGPAYNLFFGNTKENFGMVKEARSKPMNLSHNIALRILPFPLQAVEKYGMEAYYYSLSEIYCLSKGFYRLMISITELLQNNTAKEGSRELDVWPELQNLTGDVISRSAFGSSFEEGRRIFQLQTEQAELAIQAIQSVYIPGYRFLPTKRNTRMKEIDKELQNLLTNIIYKREQAIKAGEASNGDLVGLMMESNFKEIKKKNGSKKLGMSLHEIIEECKLFYFAGQETTTLLVFYDLIMRCNSDNLYIFPTKIDYISFMFHITTILI
ncbi:hypothetical protein GIB67_017246 [Kingdonia uniflora]|uniref:Cytochrome P450 n=1 Tax=Kingdonia uniflora TaxID=39325 RepID=A0A7J7NBQ2_9MAGN|nr:hypothetical protein GIB67_017246 [Kingdonia uniflora]